MESDSNLDLIFNNLIVPLKSQAEVGIEKQKDKSMFYTLLFKSGVEVHFIYDPYAPENKEALYILYPDEESQGEFYNGAIENTISELFKSLNQINCTPL